VTGVAQLRRDERGAILLIAVFFAVFAVSMLYLGIGAGEAVLFREHLQDAADAAALSGAITHARIMNVLVLINVVMAVLLAILVTLKLIEGIAIVGIAIAAALAWFTGGASLAAIPPFNALRSTMSALYEDVKPTIFDALELLHDVGDSIADAAPEASDAVVQAAIRDSGSGIVTAGFAAPTAAELPVADDAYELLCAKAGRNAIEIANIPFGAIPPLAVVMGALEKPMEIMAGALSNWFCGDGQNSLPKLDQTVKRTYPHSEKTIACERTPVKDVEAGQEASATNEACELAEQERAAAEPDAAGNCQTQCEFDGPYDRVVRQAREMCDPKGDPKPSAYKYQLEEGRVDYEWNGAKWLRGEPYNVTSTVNPNPVNLAPCGEAESALADSQFSSRPALPGQPLCVLWPSQYGATGGYNRLVHPPAEPNRVLPVCTNECMPPPPQREIPVGTRQTVSFRQVTHILACKRLEVEPVDIAQTKSPGNDDQDNKKSPKKVRDDAKLGSEQFQLRAIMIGNLQQKESARLVRLGLWGRVAPENPLEGLRQFGGFSLAQSEYFYDKADSRDAWMWNMNWRGRLKRFRLPRKDDAIDALQAVCRRHVSAKDCSRVLDMAENWDALLVH
jgi:hypothetical protein